MNKTSFCYIVDQNITHQEFLTYSVDTLLKFNSEFINKIIIIDIGMRQVEKQEMIEQLSIIIGDKNIELKFYKLDIHKADIFPELPNVLNGRLCKTTLIRFFISELLEEEYVWYCDCDVLFTSSIKEELFDFDYETTLFKAYLKNTQYGLKDIDVCKIENQINDEARTKEYNLIRLFNAGFMFINNKMFNELNCLNDVISFYNTFTEQIRLMNQDAYVYLFRKHFDKCKLVYNFNMNNNIIDKRIKAIHFVGKKRKQIHTIKSTYDKIMCDEFNSMHDKYNYLKPKVDEFILSKFNDLYSYLDKRLYIPDLSVT